jgi:hypothetical protein
MVLFFPRKNWNFSGESFLKGALEISRIDLALGLPTALRARVWLELIRRVQFSLLSVVGQKQNDVSFHGGTFSIRL